jgi:hypothetical protein
MGNPLTAATYLIMACIGACLGLHAFVTPALAQQTAQPTASPQEGTDPDEAETPWPHAIKSGAMVILVYQPQIESWDGHLLKARAAVSVAKSKDDAHPTFGIINVEARTLVDKQSRIVTIDQLTVVKADFPSAPQQASEWKKLIEDDAAGAKRTIVLDRLEANLEILNAEKKPAGSPVRNDAPRIIFSTKPAMLIYVDGMPAYRSLSGTEYERLINTRALIVRTHGGVHYLHLFDGWMTSSTLTGTWTVASRPPANLEEVQKIAVESRQVDLLTGQTDPQQPAPSLATGPVPVIHVATTPTELIVTDGEPKWTPRTRPATSSSSCPTRRRTCSCRAAGSAHRTCRARGASCPPTS